MPTAPLLLQPKHRGSKAVITRHLVQVVDVVFMGVVHRRTRDTKMAQFLCTLTLSIDF